MEKKFKDDKDYGLVIAAFKKHSQGAAIADICAGTGLALARVRELVTRAADEYGGRFEVTESGEILYSFPRGFVSRYRGLAPALKKWGHRLLRALTALGIFLFKLWIAVMLVGYFGVFMVILLCALALAMGAGIAVSRKSSRNSRRGSEWNVNGMFLAGRVFELFMRIWFYSMAVSDKRGNTGRGGPRGRPLHRSVFSFVFGDGDPNRDYGALEKRAFIAYVQSHQGVVSLPELMALTGLPPGRAEEYIIRLCVEFSGSPEATEEGTVVYRFDELLLQSVREAGDRGDAPVKKLKTFSSNPSRSNKWFCLINGINLLFGSYFLFETLRLSAPDLYSIYDASFIYGMVYRFFSGLLNNPLPALMFGLGLVPLAFSLFFWLIPLARERRLKKENEEIRLEHFRKLGYGAIWQHPEEVRSGDIHSNKKEYSPKNLSRARDGVIKEMGAYVIPDVILDEKNQEIYRFAELKREKEALEKYRRGIDPQAGSLGKTVFDSGA
jgi:hypothetical protein